jgi:F-type H+-transporting ATPase subunit b
MLSGRVLFLALSAAVMPLSAYAEEGSSGMPQLDPTFFLSQLFWLIITGSFLYLLMAKIALPRVARMVQIRNDKVHEDLEAAYNLKQQAEDIKIDYTRALRDADERAHALVENLTRELKEKQYTALAQTAARIQLKIAETENYLRGEKDALVKDAPIISERLTKVIVTQLSKGGL